MIPDPHHDRASCDDGRIDPASNCTPGKALAALLCIAILIVALIWGTS